MQAGLTAGRSPSIRAISRYLRQAGIAFSDRYMESTLVGNPQIVLLLVSLFAARLHPDAPRSATRPRSPRELESQIDAVQSLDEDRILRSFLAVVEAILRTNYYQRRRRRPPEAVSRLQARPGAAPDAAAAAAALRDLRLLAARRGRPSARRQGRARRAALVRSPRGLPHRDPRADEGADGQERADRPGRLQGRVRRQAPARGPAGARRCIAEGIACYRTFLAGLLDLTDNIVGGEIVRAARDVVRYDEDDPYLVVAADKGTATFSDIANGVSADYGFWLGDAFASGGSHGYDHKAMGITARGAWESVKRHFRELGTDIQTTDFTAVGIGDMAGDVFGNGMLLSPHIRLLAAFNHHHIFLDPDPDPAASFAERERLFELPRSAWSDYDRGADLDGRRRVRAHRQVDPDLARGRAGARDRGRRARARRADPRDPAGAGRPAVQRRHRDLS